MTIFVLDDEAIELAIWEIIIERNFKNTCKCRTFFTFDELIIAFNEEVPDCCVIDLVIPYHPGTEVCKWVSDNYPSVKLFINTSDTGEEYKILSESYNAVYLTKIDSFEKRLGVIVNACKS